MTESRAAKVFLYAGSALGPLSRMNDNAHYPSQVALGWIMAYAAATAVDRKSPLGSNWRIAPNTSLFGSGVQAEFEW